MFCGGCTPMSTRTAPSGMGCHWPLLAMACGLMSTEEQPALRPEERRHWWRDVDPQRSFVRRLGVPISMSEIDTRAGALCG